MTLFKKIVRHKIAFFPRDFLKTSHEIKGEAKLKTKTRFMRNVELIYHDFHDIRLRLTFIDFDSHFCETIYWKSNFYTLFNIVLII
jgi:hypothetical protein